MTAQDFANANENVMVWFAGVGCPAGQAIALLPETALPFDLSEIEGAVEDDGMFNATNMTHGPGARDWTFSDWNANTVYRIKLYTDAAEWARQHDEYMAQS